MTKRFAKLTILQRVENALRDKLYHAFGGVLFTTFICGFLSQTRLLSFTQTYRRAKNRAGEEVAVHPKVKKLTQEVLDVVLLTPKHEAAIEFFTLGYGDILFSKGSLHTSEFTQSALIGISPVFELEDVYEFRARGPMIRNELLDVDDPALENYCENSILSDKAKKFGIAREIMKVNDHNVTGRLGVCALATTGAFVTGSFLHSHPSFQAFTVWRKVRWLGYVSVVFASAYKLTVNLYDNHRERRSDRWAAELGKEYAEGGVEFYNKALERNKALREYFGGSYEKHYTVYGNELDNRWFVPTVKLTERRNNLVKYLAKYTEQEQEEQEEKEAEEKEKQKEAKQ